MTVFILEKYKRVAMSFKYLGSMIIVLILMSFGYFVWPPTLNIIRYGLHIVDTETPLYWFIFVNIIRAILSMYIVYKYAIIAKKVEETTKKKIQWFLVGIIIVILALIINIIGGVIESIIIEIIALITIDIGSLAILKGFLL